MCLNQVLSSNTLRVPAIIHSKGWRVMLRFPASAPGVAVRGKLVFPSSYSHRRHIRRHYDNLHKYFHCHHYRHTIMIIMIITINISTIIINIYCAENA